MKESWCLENEEQAEIAEKEQIKPQEHTAAGLEPEQESEGVSEQRMRHRTGQETTPEKVQKVKGENLSQPWKKRKSEEKKRIPEEVMDWDDSQIEKSLQ